jgi:hypothetical protein
LEELSAGREGFKAKMFQQQVVERIVDKEEGRPAPIAKELGGNAGKEGADRPQTSPSVPIRQ